MFYIVAAVLVLFFLASAVKILREYERGVVFRLGRVIKTKGPGLIILIPIIDKMVKVSLRLVTMDVPSQDVITKDNVSVKVDAVVYFRVMEPNKATIEVENYIFATSQLAQTTLRSVCGQAELDELLSERDQINTRLQNILDQHTDPWGIKVTAVEVKRIDLPLGGFPHPLEHQGDLVNLGYAGGSGGFRSCVRFDRQAGAREILQK